MQFSWQNQCTEWTAWTLSYEVYKCIFGGMDWHPRQFWCVSYWPLFWTQSNEWKRHRFTMFMYFEYNVNGNINTGPKKQFACFVSYLMHQLKMRNIESTIHEVKWIFQSTITNPMVISYVEKYVEWFKTWL